MKRFLFAVLTCAFLFGCTEDKVIDGKTYEQKGLFTMDEKDTTIKYNVSMGNVIWSCILCETIVVPVVLCGWYLWEPGYKISTK